MSWVSVVLPEPVGPISATARPAGMSRSMPVEHRRPVRVVGERDALEADRPVAGGHRARRPGRRARPGSVSSTSKMRVPPATARWAWPISIPSERNGTISMVR